MAFNRVAFLASFVAGLDSLRAAESTTKRELRELSRVLLDGLHNGDLGVNPGDGSGIKGDIQYINALMGVLTPVNRKAAVLYFQHFTGFHFDKNTGVFVAKDKKRYEGCVDLSAEFLAEPGNNIWTWAERNIEMEKKPYDLKRLTKAVENALKETDNNHAGVLRAILAGGVAPDAIIALMLEMGKDMPIRKNPVDMGMAEEIVREEILPPF